MKFLIESDAYEYYEQLWKNKSKLTCEQQKIFENMFEITSDEFIEIYDQLTAECNNNYPTDTQLNDVLSSGAKIADKLGFDSWDMLLSSRERHDGYIYLKAEIEEGDCIVSYIPAWSKKVDIREESEIYNCDIYVSRDIPLSKTKIGSNYFGVEDNIFSKKEWDLIENIISGVFLECPTLDEIAGYIEENADFIAQQLKYDDWNKIMYKK